MEISALKESGVILFYRKHFHQENFIRLNTPCYKPNSFSVLLNKEGPAGGRFDALTVFTIPVPPVRRLAKAGVEPAGGRFLGWGTAVFGTFTAGRGAVATRFLGVANVAVFGLLRPGVVRAAAAFRITMPTGRLRSIRRTGATAVRTACPIFRPTWRRFTLAVAGTSGFTLR